MGVELQVLGASYNEDNGVKFQRCTILKMTSPWNHNQLCHSDLGIYQTRHLRLLIVISRPRCCRRAGRSSIPGFSDEVCFKRCTSRPRR